MIVGLLLMLLAWAMANSVFAQDSFDEQGITIKPAIVDIAAVENNETEITITNTSPASIAVQATVEPLVVKDPLTNPLERSRYDVSAWVKLSEDSWVLERGRETTVKIKIEPPKEPVPGGHYGQIAFRVVSAQADSTNSGAVVRPEVVALLFITVPGDVVEHLSVAQEVTKKLIVTGPISSTLTLNNSGNVHLLVRPFLKIGDGQNAKFTADADVQVLTPGTSRQIEINYDPNILFGRFKVWSEASYGSPARTAVSTAVEVIVISPFLIGALLFGLIAAIAFFSGRASSNSRLSYKSTKKQRSKRAGGYHHPKTKSEKKIIKSNK